MNLIHRQVQIFKTFRFIDSNTQRQFLPEDIIFENFENFEDQNYINVINNYKTQEKNQNPNIDSSWQYIDNSDKRRKILKDENGFYNYIPVPNNDNNYGNDNSIYAKNENEILYHYLYYKTLLCKYCDLSNENEKNELCPYAHDILKDFRIIYDYKNEKIILLALLIMNSNLFQIENYLNYIPMNPSTTNINLDTFKIHDCQRGKECPNDSEICPFYHSTKPEDEQRRPLPLFRYCCTKNSGCYNALFQNYCPDKCCNGIFCPFLHSKNEEKYYNQKDYIRENKTCEGNVDEKEIEKEIEKDENIEKTIKKVKNSIKIGKYFMCRKCNNIPNDGELCYIIKCKHFLCLKCFKKMNKEKKDSELILCPFCGVKIKKKKILLINFNK
jgi:hypothetical protein